MSVNSWCYLLIAIPFGVLGTISMKLSEGLVRWKPTVCLVIFYLISFVAMTLAIQGLGISVVYAIWSGVGTVLVAIIGVLVFNEYFSYKKMFYLFLIIVGVIGVHLNNVFLR